MQVDGPRGSADLYLRSATRDEPGTGGDEVERLSDDDFDALEDEVERRAQEDC